MSQFDEVLASPEWAFTLAAALEQQLGDDRILTVGSARTSVAELLGDEPARAVALRFTRATASTGTIALVAVAAFAEALERAASDEILLTVVRRRARRRGPRDRRTGRRRRRDRAGVRDRTRARRRRQRRRRRRRVYPLLDGSDLLGCLVLRIGTAARARPRRHRRHRTATATTATATPGARVRRARTCSPTSRWASPPSSAAAA